MADSWPRTWPWDSRHVHSIHEGWDDSLKGVHPHFPVVTLGLDWGHGECCGCPRVRRNGYQMREKTCPKSCSELVIWFLELCPLNLPLQNQFCSKRLGAVPSGNCLGDRIQFQGHSYSSLLLGHIGHLLPSIVELFLHEAFCCLEMPPPHIQRSMDRGVTYQGILAPAARGGKKAPWEDPLLYDKASTGTIPESQ